jgi:hypothetical protein
MRASLKQSLKDAGESDAFRYAKGSIVICNACAKPIARLEHGIALGDKAGRMASAFKPLNGSDLDTLATRQDIDAGVRAWATSLTPDPRKAHLAALKEFRAGDPMICPVCQESFVQVLSVEKHEVLDKAYVIELVTLPPEGHKVAAIRGKRLGVNEDWIHEGAEVIH